MSCDTGADLNDGTENGEIDQEETDTQQGEVFSIIGTSWEGTRDGVSTTYFFNPLNRGYTQNIHNSGDSIIIYPFNYSYIENTGSVTVTFDDTAIPSLTFSFNQDYSELSNAIQDYTRQSDLENSLSIDNSYWTYTDPDNSRLSYYVFYIDDTGDKVITPPFGSVNSQSFTYDYDSTARTGNLTLEYGITTESLNPWPITSRTSEINTKASGSSC